MINGTVFLLVPNNSGSTFMYKSICNCAGVSHLPKEGQFINGYNGTRPSDYNCQFIWAGTDFQHIISDEIKHDWDEIKKAWWRKTLNKNPKNLFVEKSPPHIAKLKMLKENFTDSKFIVSVRNPYAVFESITRARKNNPVSNTIIAKHVINTLIIQKQNIESLSPNEHVFFTYEELCADPVSTADKIKTLSTKFYDLTFNQKIPVKNRYESSVHNFNDDQIKSLDNQSINDLNDILKYNVDTLEYYGYEII